MTTKLEVERKALGLGRGPLALAGLTYRQRIANLENGRVVPPRDSIELIHLARALGLPDDEAASLLDEAPDV